MTSPTHDTHPWCSIIVPVWNEAELISRFLKHLRERAPEAEIIVVDASSHDGNAALSEPLADRVLVADHGRAQQMNAGARAAKGEALWFLHVDSELPTAPLDAIRAALIHRGIVGGCFRIRFPRREWVYRISDRLGNMCVDLFQIALGDHGIFCRRDEFLAVGGYPEVPLMEDADLYRALRSRGQMRQLRPHIVTSARRYESCGRYRTTAVYLLVLALYLMRVSHRTLLRIYRGLLSNGRADNHARAHELRHIAPVS